MSADGGLAKAVGEGGWRRRVGGGGLADDGRDGAGLACMHVGGFAFYFYIFRDSSWRETPTPGSTIWHVIIGQCGLEDVS